MTGGGLTCGGYVSEDRGVRVPRSGAQGPPLFSFRVGLWWLRWRDRWRRHSALPGMRTMC
jgi:hypothetical protein